MRINRRLRRRLAWIGFLAIVGFFLLTEHRAHLFGWWPFLLLVLALGSCPRSPGCGGLWALRRERPRGHIGLAAAPRLGPAP